MTAQTTGNPTTRQQLILTIAPFVIVALAGMAVRTPLATAYPLSALLLFLWIVPDTMMVALIARSPTRRPGRQAILGVLAGSSFTVWFGSPLAMRAVLMTKPIIMMAMAGMFLGHIVWASVRARRALNRRDDGQKDRWIAATSEILPLPIVRLAAAELTIIHMALFRWGGPADVPAGCRGFAYYKHVTPIGVTLLVLSTIEIAIYHLLVGHWSRTAAIVMFVLSDVGFVYLVGLLKSFRFKPVLLTPEGVRVRAGFLIDQAIPLDSIVSVETSFTGESIRNPTTFNAALLAWPNVILRLDQPMSRRSLLPSKRSFNSVAFRLDDPLPFVRLLIWRLGQKPG